MTDFDGNDNEIPSGTHDLRDDAFDNADDDETTLLAADEEDDNETDDTPSGADTAGDKTETFGVGPGEDPSAGASGATEAYRTNRSPDVG
ncbi:hypothetical protein [Spelaeicoccus albus]|uniref:Uncharacterized protein n=1 Tax=Spelaeicoccus albus TaxID=1280376 RepID=A0A7Z0IIV1_9MICO|nr:hypothetical protein [Spelaeicoccus albus]NYI68737.1 hypothetical protein [Spelaeicoccus albus]